MRTRATWVTALSLALLPTLFGKAFFPHARLSFCAPLIVWLFYRRSFLGVLWASLGLGLLLDLLSSGHQFGMHAASFSLATTFLYRQKRHFYAASLSTLPLLTWFFVLLTTLTQVILFTAAGGGKALGGPWLLSDMVVLPLADALWAFFGFALPLHLLQLRRRTSDAYELPRPR